MHQEGVPAGIIAKTFQITDQSLERILASLDGREMQVLAVDNDPNVKALRSQNAELTARLAKYEDSEDGEEVQEEEEDEDPEA
jgi:hypothetical protein